MEKFEGTTLREWGKGQGERAKDKKDSVRCEDANWPPVRSWCERVGCSGDARCAGDLIDVNENKILTLAFVDSSIPRFGRQMLRLCYTVMLHMLSPLSVV
jgi:hypothetical protein